MGVDRIAAAFAAAEREKRAAFIPFLMAGDPSLAHTARQAAALRKGGADILELGVPFSDPIADGPENQRAAERALASGTTLSGVLACVRAMRDAGETLPIVLFTYYNPIHRMGTEAFADRAATLGVDGILVVDLPPEEAEEYLAAARKRALATIFLASPTTDADRLKLVGDASAGFVYCVSRLGVTGERANLPETLDKKLERLRAATKKPVAVGFGISTPEQAARAARSADGVVVGSALVRLVAKNPESAPETLEKAAREFVAALRQEAR